MIFEQEKNLMTTPQKMHLDEIAVDEKTVRRLLQEQSPQYADLSVELVQSYGTDHALFRLGSECVIRLPRRDSAVASLQKEYDILPKIASRFSFTISKPIFFGYATPYYPFPWAIFEWIEGANPDFEEQNNYQDLAIDLAQFLNQLHAIKSDTMPESRRGVSIYQQDEETCEALSLLQHDLINPDEIFCLWESLCDFPDWDRPPVLIHGDLLPGNILIANNRLTGIIDWSDVGVGDPAVDCIIAWAIFNKKSRSIFKANLKIDGSTWHRGKGWALSIALIGFAYYKNTNKPFARILYRMLQEVMRD